MSKDYYKTLGVEKTASADEIKKAFRKVAHKYHPDKQTGDEKKFKEANEAYQTLSSPEKRAQYDRFGSAGPNMGGFGGGGQGFGGFDFNGGGAGGFDFGDIDLGDLFGGGFGGGRSSRRQRGADLQTRLQLSFSESVFGVTKKVAVERNAQCGDCSGSGAKPGTDMKTCTECHGEGKVQQRMMGIFATLATCPTCQGRGKIPKEKCSPCRGAGIKRSKEEIEFAIPAGIAHGDTIRIAGKGEMNAAGSAGDLFVSISVTGDKVFTRQGIDLHMTQEITVSEAILGATRKIKQLDGSMLEVKIPGGTQSGSLLRVAGKGIKTNKGTGHLLVKVKVHIPKKLSKKAKEALVILQSEGF